MSPNNGGSNSNESDTVTLPTHIYSQESPNLKITSYTLNGNNYPEWQRSVQIVIKGKGKFGYLTGTIAEPETDDPKYHIWESENSMVMGWLINSMEPAINKKYMFFHTAKEIWDGAQKMYSDKGNTSQMFETRQKLKDLRQGNLSVTSYFSQLQDLWRELDLYSGIEPLCAKCTLILNTQKETEQVYEFLTGLNNFYDDTRASIIRTKPLPTTEEAFAEIRREETRRRLMLTNLADQEVEQSALIATQGEKIRFQNHEIHHQPKYNLGQQFQNQTGANHESIALNTNRQKVNFDQKGGRKSDRPWCDHCQRPGHFKTGCWEIHGKPANWTPKKQERRSFQGDMRHGGGRGGGGFNHGNYVATQTSVLPQLNKEQLDKLYTLLQPTTTSFDGPSCSVAKSGSINGEDDWQC